MHRFSKHLALAAVLTALPTSMLFAQTTPQERS